MEVSRRNIGKLVGAMAVVSATSHAAGAAEAKNEQDRGPWLIKLACHELSARYSHALSSGKYEALEQIFSPEGTLKVLGREDRGPAAIIANLRSNPGLSQPGERVRHVITNEVIEVISAEAARGTAFFAIHRFNTLNGPNVPSLAPVAFATSQDEYVLTSAGWRLAIREIHLEAAVAQ